MEPTHEDEDDGDCGMQEVEENRALDAVDPLQRGGGCKKN
jgi:hypothetical protein